MRSAKKEIKMPRPKIAEPRTRQLNLSLTASELDTIQNRARALGMRPVHFGRAVLLDQRRIVASTNEASNHTRLIYDQLARLGNNLNQLVRHLHQSGDPLPRDLEPLLNDIRRVLAKVSE
jgi:hypothetical protein